MRGPAPIELLRLYVDRSWHGRGLAWRLMAATLAAAAERQASTLWLGVWERNFTSNDLRAIDGPFAESKELIGGFAIRELSGMEEAIELCRPYAEILGGTLEIDVRLVDQDDGAVHSPVASGNVDAG